MDYKKLKFFLSGGNHFIFKNKLFLLSIFSVIIFGFLFTNFFAYFSSRESLRKEISDNELPITSDNVYSEIQRDVLRPIFISSQMACDTFLRDWIIAGEKDSEQLVRYLDEIKKKFETFTSFFVSEQTRTYYYYGGILKKVSKDEPRDVWYFRVREMKKDYEINVDPDMANKDAMTIFVNYRVYGYNGEYLGATGVGLTIDAVISLIERYQEKYHRTIYFTDSEGNVKLCGKGFSSEVKNISSLPHGNEILAAFKKRTEKSLMYTDGNRTIHFNVRFIPEFNWFLVVEQQEDVVTKNIFSALLTNIIMSFLATIIVLVMCALIVKKYNKEIELLRGIIPICCICKKIRNDKGYWDQVETYISEHSKVIFSHGICPDCMNKHYSEFSKNADNNKGEKSFE